jgi:hypothetical protein
VSTYNTLKTLLFSDIEIKFNVLDRMFMCFEDINCCIVGSRDPETEGANAGSTACGWRRGAEQ